MTSANRTRTGVFVLVGMVVALILAGVVSSYADGSPDGLIKTAEQVGFIESEQDHALSDSPVAGYTTEGIGNDALSGGVAGVVGVLLTFGVGGLIFLAVRPRRRTRQDATDRGSDGS